MTRPSRDGDAQAGPLYAAAPYAPPRRASGEATLAYEPARGSRPINGDGLENRGRSVPGLEGRADTDRSPFDPKMQHAHLVGTEEESGVFLADEVPLVEKVFQDSFLGVTGTEKTIRELVRAVGLSAVKSAPVPQEAVESLQPRGVVENFAELLNESSHSLDPDAPSVKVEEFLRVVDVSRPEGNDLVYDEVLCLGYGDSHVGVVDFVA